MRLLNAKDFEPGPFNLGRFGPFIATIAILWVCFITVRKSRPIHSNLIETRPHLETHLAPSAELQTRSSGAGRALCCGKKSHRRLGSPALLSFSDEQWAAGGITRWEVVHVKCKVSTELG